VLSLNTGHTRDYGSGVVYGDYFDSPALMFPAVVADHRLSAKDYVFGMRAAGAAKAWPLGAFAGGRVIDDALGRQPVVLIGWEERREVLAYDRGAHSFAAASTPDRLVDESGRAWTLSEEALLGPGGERLSRLPGHVAYWFAWDSFVGVASELYEMP
jgi:hypothetical protein